MHRYWSAMAMLSIRPVAAVEPTSDTRPRTRCTNRRVMPPTKPPAVMAPPKHMAQMMSQMVPIMPAMPRVATSEVSISLWVGKAVLPYTLIIEARNSEGSISCSTSRCHIRPAPTASSIERNSVMRGGVRRAMSTPVSTGTDSSHGVT